MDKIRQMAVEIVVHEGGLSKNKNDRGGITNFGVSLRYARGKGLVMDLNHDGSGLRSLGRRRRCRSQDTDCGSSG